MAAKNLRTEGPRFVQYFWTGFGRSARTRWLLAVQARLETRLLRSCGISESSSMNHDFRDATIHQPSAVGQVLSQPRRLHCILTTRSLEPHDKSRNQVSLAN